MHLLHAKKSKVSEILIKKTYKLGIFWLTLLVEHAVVHFRGSRALISCPVAVLPNLGHLASIYRRLAVLVDKLD